MGTLDRLLMNNRFENVLASRTECVTYLESHPAFIDAIDGPLRAYKHIQDLIPESSGKLFSGHIFPYNESEVELETSVHHVVNCFYKSAMISLRNCLELGLVYIYYDRNNDSERIIRTWLSSKESTPFKRTIIAGLTKVDLISALNFSVPILQKVDALYGRLSNYVHTAGYRFSANFLNRSNVNRFNKASLREYVDTLASCIALLSVLFLCKYPVGLHYTPVDDKFGLNGPVGTFLNPYQVAQVKEVIDSEILSILEPLCLKDAGAISLAAWVNERPDITQEELNAQADRMDKDEIRRSGYRTWYKNMGGSQSGEDPELNKFFQERHARLEAWARENGCYESGSVLAPDAGSEAP